MAWDMQALCWTASRAMQSEKGKYLVLSVENNGSIPGLADEDVIETTCLVSKDGIQPVKVKEVPEHCYLLIRLIKMYEKLTVEAVKNHSKETAVQALMLHPLVIPILWPNSW